jgi:hypothetical protein
MSVDADWQESPFSEGSYAQNEEPLLGEMPHKPIHVKVVDTQSQSVAPEFAALATVQPVAAGQVPTQLIPHRYHRYKTKFTWTIPTGFTVWIATKPDSISSPTPPPTVYQLAPGQNQPDYDGQQPLYAVYTGNGTGLPQVSIMDESYGTVQ